MDSRELIDETKRYHRAIDVPVANLVKKARAQGHTIPCKRGCDACCYEPTHVTHVELAPLIERLRHMPTAELDEIERRIEAWFFAMTNAGMDPQLIPEAPEEMRRYHRLHLACPLLDLEKHECRVYAERPLACRCYWLINQDPSACANRAEEPTVNTLDFREVAAAPVMAFLSKWAKANKREELSIIEFMLTFWLREAWPLVRDRSKSIPDWMLAVERRMTATLTVLDGAIR